MQLARHIKKCNCAPHRAHIIQLHQGLTVIRVETFAIVALAAFTTATAKATTVTKTFVGTITGANTKDTNGLFGPAGADLSGQTVTIRTRYVTNLLPNMSKCRIHPGSCSVDSSQGGAPRAVATSFVVAGTTETYSSTIYGDIVFDNGNQNRFVAETNVFSGQSQGGRGSAVNVSFEAPVVFGKQLSPGNKPVPNRSDLMSFFKPGDTYASEFLTFVVTKAGR